MIPPAIGTSTLQAPSGDAPGDNCCTVTRPK